MSNQPKYRLGILIKTLLLVEDGESIRSIIGENKCLSGDIVVVSLTPGASYALEKNAISYRTIVAYSPDDSACHKEGLKNFERITRIVASSKEIFPFHTIPNLTPAQYSIYNLKFLLDVLWTTVITLNAIIASEKPDFIRLYTSGRSEVRASVCMHFPMRNPFIAEVLVQDGWHIPVTVIRTAQPFKNDMSNYDRLTSGTRYKANVQHALDFLRKLQYAHTVAYSSNLIANEILDGATDTTALLADCGECLLSAKFAMDAYGVSLATASGYSVQTFANNLYYSIAVTGWRGTAAQYYDTSYPYGQNTNVPFTYEEKISYTQALCSWAVYVFAKSAYQTAGDFSSQCEICLSYINTLTRGSWGGEYYCPYTGASGQTQNEYSGYAALMAVACQTVDSVTYASLIAGLISFIKWLSLSGGQVCDMVDVKGRVWRSQIGTTEGGFLILPIALALLAGAGV